MNPITIPDEDLTLLHHLPLKVRKEIDAWLPAINRLLTMPKGVCAGFKEVAEALGSRPNTVRGVYYQVLTAITEFNSGLRDMHPWRVLINERSLGGNNAKVPSVFIPHWHGLVLDNQRNTHAAHKALARQWRQGEPIPGFPPETRGGPKLPRGLTYRNLIRDRYMPARAQIAFARSGIAEARKFLPHCLQDVSQVRPLEYILFDDVELDFLIIVPESLTPVKLRLIVAMDLCSRMILGYGVRPGLTRPDGVEDGLKLRDMKAVVAHLLRKWGVPTEYLMNFIVERGTATLPQGTIDALTELSGGQIIVHPTSMVVGQVFEFRDKATGNSFGKAWLESFFNPLHGELAHLPGQKGRRYDLAPAELEGRKKELAQLVRAGRRLPIELRYQFRLPFKTGAEALEELDAALHRLHTETGRQLQGFDQVALWRLNETDSWKPEMELIEQWPELIGRVQMTTRPETPMERFTAKIGAAARREIPDCSLQRLMDEHAPVRFQDYQFAFTYHGKDYVYLPPDSMLPLLEHGAQYLLWFHPQDMSIVYVTRAAPHLGYVGKLTRFTVERRGDLEAAKKQMAEKARAFGHALRGVQGVKVDRLRQRAEDIAANTEVLRNAQALEMEVDFAPSAADPASADAPESIRQITDDLHARATTKRTVQKLSHDADVAFSRDPGASNPKTPTLDTQADEFFCR